MNNRILARLFRHQADICRAKRHEAGAVTKVTYEPIRQGVPCLISKMGAAKQNLTTIQLEDVAGMERSAKGFFDWEIDIQPGDVVTVTGKEGSLGQFYVGEVFCYAGSHKECRLTRKDVAL